MLEAASLEHGLSQVLGLLKGLGLLNINHVLCLNSDNINVSDVLESKARLQCTYNCVYCAINMGM